MPESPVTLCFAYFRSSVTITATTELFLYITRTLRNSANVVYFVKQRQWAWQNRNWLECETKQLSCIHDKTVQERVMPR